jgi:hypothetical protein
VGRVAEASGLFGAGLPSIHSWRAVLSGIELATFRYVTQRFDASTTRLPVRTDSRVVEAPAYVPEGCGFDSRENGQQTLDKRPAPKWPLASTTLPTGGLGGGARRRMTKTLRAGSNVLLCTLPVNKHLARVRFGRCPLPVIGSGTSSLFDLIIARSDKVVAQGSNPHWQKSQKKNPLGVGGTEVVARSNKPESIINSSRDVVRQSCRTE